MSLPRVFALLMLLAVAHARAAQPASLHVTSHVDGEIVLGSREVSLELSLVRATPDARVRAWHDGAPAGLARHGDTVTLELTLDDNRNRIVVQIANPGQDPGASVSIELHYPFVSLTNGQAAALAIGQADPSSVAERDDAQRFGTVIGRPLVHTGTLFLPDTGNDRVLAYRSVPTASDATADFVIGQPAIDEFGSPISLAGFGSPQTLATDGTRLLVADYAASRIVVFDAFPDVSGAAADRVIGQVDDHGAVWACSPTALAGPESVFVLDGRLFVADSENDRVLIWNAVPTDATTAADVVLGQSGLSSCEPNDDDQDGTEDASPTARTLRYPTDVWSDGDRLFVADANNNRILIWNGIPTADFTPADLVLGQPDMFSNRAGRGAAGLNHPYFLHGNGNQLFVADTENHRVLVWNRLPTESGVPADVVLGQPDMASAAADGGSSSVNGRGFRYPTGVYAFENHLFVADKENHRYLMFEGTGP